MTRPVEVDLTVRRVIAAAPYRVFEAWTAPTELLAWWGPPGGRCLDAQIDLRVGGRYRIDNETADGAKIVIEGEFLTVEAPDCLVYTWSTSGDSSQPERVTVRFDDHDGGTEITILHERINGPALRRQHDQGWTGCLDGLIAHLT